jgi:hypothetical protein
MAVAALNSLGAASRSAASIGNRAVAQGLADELMAEVLQTAYSDPDGTSVFGPDGAESTGPRAAFDDVDDYHGWSQSPPQDRNGDVIPNREDWRHRVEVTFVQSANPTLPTPGNTDQGVKRIHITIEYQGQRLAEQLALRTNTD